MLVTLTRTCSVAVRVDGGGSGNLVDLVMHTQAGIRLLERLLGPYIKYSTWGCGFRDCLSLV